MAASKTANKAKILLFILLSPLKGWLAGFLLVTKRWKSDGTGIESPPDGSGKRAGGGNAFHVRMVTIGRRLLRYPSIILHLTKPVAADHY
jgi:hypothetical protein